MKIDKKIEGVYSTPIRRDDLYLFPMSKENRHRLAIHINICVGEELKVRKLRTEVSKQMASLSLEFTMKKLKSFIRASNLDEYEHLANEVREMIAGRVHYLLKEREETSK